MCSYGKISRDRYSNIQSRCLLPGRNTSRWHELWHIKFRVTGRLRMIHQWNVITPRAERWLLIARRHHNRRTASTGTRVFLWHSKRHGWWWQGCSPKAQIKPGLHVVSWQLCNVQRYSARMATLSFWCCERGLNTTGKSRTTVTWLMWPVSTDNDTCAIYTFCTLTNTHTCLMALCPGLPWSAGTRKVKLSWTLLKQETVSGSGISWDICKSATRSRQITTPAPHHSDFYRPDALPAA